MRWGIEVRDQIESHGRVVGTRLRFSDYAAMARGLGLHGERVERADDLPAAIARALAHRPALLDVLVTPDAVSSDARSGLAWVPDLQALAAWERRRARVARGVMPGQVPDSAVLRTASRSAIPIGFLRMTTEPPTAASTAADSA